MFASCNGEATIILDDEHCGHRKNNWFRDDMLSPTDAEVEKVFKYSANGKISAVRNRPSSNVAQDMIHNLGLDSFHLERIVSRLFRHQRCLMMRTIRMMRFVVL